MNKWADETKPHALFEVIDSLLHNPAESGTHYNCYVCCQNSEYQECHVVAVFVVL